MTWEWVVLIIGLAAITACVITYSWAIDVREKNERILELITEVNKLKRMSHHSAVAEYNKEMRNIDE